MTRKIALLFTLSALALTSSAFAGPRLSEHEQLAKDFEEDLGFVTMTFMSDIRWFSGGRLYGANKEFFEHLKDTKKCATAIGDALRCHESDRTVAHHLRMTREALDCLSAIARQVRLGRKSETFLASATKNFAELERCIAPPVRHHHQHSRVDPAPRPERGDFRPERAEIDPRELIVRSIFERLSERR